MLMQRQRVATHVCGEIISVVKRCVKAWMRFMHERRRAGRAATSLRPHGSPENSAERRNEKSDR